MALYMKMTSGKNSMMENTGEILADNTVKSLKYIHAVYDLAKEQGDVTDSSYEALEKRWKDENAERSEKVKKAK